MGHGSTWDENAAIQPRRIRRCRHAGSGTGAGNLLPGRRRHRLGRRTRRHGPAHRQLSGYVGGRVHLGLPSQPGFRRSGPGDDPTDAVAQATDDGRVCVWRRGRRRPVCADGSRNRRSVAACGDAFRALGHTRSPGGNRGLGPVAGDEPGSGGCRRRSDLCRHRQKGADKASGRRYTASHIVRPASNGVVHSGGPGTASRFFIE